MKFLQLPSAASGGLVFWRQRLSAGVGMLQQQQPHRCNTISSNNSANTTATATTDNTSPAADTSATGGDAVRHSPLHALHQRHAGRIVPFAGYALPVQYGRYGIAASHRHCRRSAALFDVSHMQQTRLRGPDAIECFESICTADVAAALRLADTAEDGRAALSVFTRPNGGIVDDLIVTRVGEQELFVVSNAGRRAEDKEVMEEAVARFRSAGKRVDLEFVDSAERALIAVQGPRAVRVSGQF